MTYPSTIPRCLPLLFAVALLALLAPHPAQAEPAAGAAKAPPGQADLELAEQLFQAGNLAYDAGRLEDARAAYQRAFELKQGFDIAANLGAVELELGDYRSAAEHLDYSLRVAGSGQGAERRRATQERLAQARQKVGTAHVRVNVEGAAVLVDHIEVGTAPIERPVFVEPGKRTFSARLPSYLGKPVRRSVSAGEELVIELELAPATAGPDNGPDQVNGSGPSLPVVIAGSALAVAGLAVGVGLTVASSNEADYADEQAQELAALEASRPCEQYSSRCDDIDEALNARDAMATGALVGYLVGGIAAAGTLSYVLLSGAGDEGQDDGDQATRAPRLELRPAVGLGSSALFLRGSW